MLSIKKRERRLGLVAHPRQALRHWARPHCGACSLRTPHERISSSFFVCHHFFLLFLSKSVLKHFKKVKDFGRAVTGHTRWKNCSGIPRWTLFYATCFCIFQLRFLTNVIAIFHWYVGPALGYSRTFHPFFLLAFGTAQASVLPALTLHQPWPQVQSFLSRKFSPQLLKNFTYKHEILTQAHHLQV